MTEKEKIDVGIVVAPHGIRGGLRVKSLTDVKERFASGNYLYLGRPENFHPIVTKSSLPFEPPPKIHIERCSWIQPEMVLLETKEIMDRNQAEFLRGWALVIDEDMFVTPQEENVFFHYQLVDLAVLRDGEKIGHIVEVHNWGAHDTLQIRLLDNREVLIPFTHENVPEVNVKEGFVHITPIPGLIEEQLS